MSNASDHFVNRHHHITIATGGPQECYDFHTKVLGMKCVKKTAFYDGVAPIYHLYFGNDTGDESSLVTTFPVAHTGVKGRKGTGQVGRVTLSVAPQALSYWQQRLTGMGFAVTETERVGERCLDFQHPCGVDYTLAGVADDPRAFRNGGPVPAEFTIRGTHAITVNLRDAEVMEEFLQMGWGATRVADDTSLIRYRTGKSTGGSGTGALIDLAIEPARKAGTWTVAEGTVHHMAFQIASHAAQNALKQHLEGLGYTDTSDVKNRGYFDSIYVRTPSGAMFEATVTHDDGFTCDEPRDRLGLEVMVSPNLTMTRDEMLAQLGYLRD